MSACRMTRAMPLPLCAWERWLSHGPRAVLVEESALLCVAKYSFGFPFVEENLRMTGIPDRQGYGDEYFVNAGVLGTLTKSPNFLQGKDGLLHRSCVAGQLGRPCGGFPFCGPIFTCVDAH